MGIFLTWEVLPPPGRGTTRTPLPRPVAPPDQLTQPTQSARMRHTGDRRESPPHGCHPDRRVHPPGPATSTCRRSVRTRPSSSSARPCTSASPSRCCSGRWPRCWSSACWPTRSASAAMVPGAPSTPARSVYGFVRNSLARDIHRQQGLPAVRALPGRALLLPPGQQPTSGSSRSSSSRRSRARHSLRPRALLSWLALQRRRHAPPRCRAATSSCRRCPPVSVARSCPADPAGVPLQHPGAPGHAGAASLREHVRRPPAADPLRPGRRVPAGRDLRPRAQLVGPVAW